MSSFVDIASLWTCTRYILRKKIEFLAQTQIFPSYLCKSFACEQRRTRGAPHYFLAVPQMTSQLTIISSDHTIFLSGTLKPNLTQNVIYLIFRPDHTYFSSGPHIIFIWTTHNFRPDHTYVSSGPHIFFIWTTHNFRPDHTHICYFLILLLNWRFYVIVAGFLESTTKNLHILASGFDLLEVLWKEMSMNCFINCLYLYNYVPL